MGLEEKNMARIEQAFATCGLSVKGATPDLESCERGDRVDEIFMWLNNSGDKEKVVNAWIAIDDLDLISKNSKLEASHFVRTDDKVGFTWENAEEAIIKLRGQLS